MKRMIPLYLAAVLAVAGCAGTKPAKKEAPPYIPPTAAEEAAMMKAWGAYMTPAEEHQRMAADCGEWIAAGKMWMAPGAPAEESTGTATISMVLGGRYQKTEYRSDWQGMPIEGLGYTAYDNVTGEYVSTWMDNMGTGLSVTRGKAVDKGRIELVGDMTTADGSMAIRNILICPGGDTMVMEMYATAERYGGEFKMMELTFTRKR